MELHIFDFDDTLFRSPDPPEGWAHPPSWWSSPDSLQEPYVLPGQESKLALPTVSKAKQSLRDKNVVSAVVTGRRDVPGMERRIKQLLAKLGIEMQVFLKPRQMQTAEYKADKVEELVGKLPEVDKVVMWDDWVDNLNAVKQRVASSGVSFVPKLVVNNTGSFAEMFKRDFDRLAGLVPMPGFGEESLEEDVGDTIAKQMGGMNRLVAMLGASQFVKDGKSLQFKWPAKQRSRGNVVKITLRPDDTYDMEFFNVSMKGKKSVKKFEGVYADKLAEIFEKHTGWYLSL